MEIDMVMPTKESADVIGATLDRAATAIDNAGVAVDHLVVADESMDGTLDVGLDRAQRYGWTTAFADEPATLPEARERAIDVVETEWFWFLDDVRVWEDYVQRQLDAIAPAVGAVQGRKADWTEHPSDWSRRRARRGGTHATLIRHEAFAREPAATDRSADEVRDRLEDLGYM